MRNYFTVLTIAGSDSSGGAGIQADIKTMSAIGCYGMSAITSITAQNTTGVRSIMPVTPQVVADQIDMVMEDVPPLAIKIGMLCNAEIAATVADKLEQYRPGNVVLDPVMVSTSGSLLLEQDAIDVVTSRLFPLSTIITPNQHEARVLTGETETDRQARVLMDMGAENILIKGGDTDRNDVKIDLSVSRQKDFTHTSKFRCGRYAQHSRDRLHTVVCDSFVSRIGVRPDKCRPPCQTIYLARS